MRLNNNKTALYRIGFIASENVYYVLRPVINISSILFDLKLLLNVFK